MSFYTSFRSLIAHLCPLTAFDIKALHRFCRNGNIRYIDEIFRSKKLILIDVPFKNLFSDACSGGNLEIVQYLLTSPHTKPYIPKDFSLYEGLYYSSLHGYLGILEYLLTSKDTEKYNLNINYVPEVFKVSCETLNWHTIDFLRKSPKLKEKFNLHDNSDLFFEQLFNNKKTEIIEELIFDLNFEKTKNIEEHLNNFKIYNQDNEYLIKVKKMFDIRELENELSIGLINNKETKKRIKV